MTDKNPPASLDKYESAVLLKDGSLLRVRPIAPQDEDRLIAFVHKLSPRSKYLRFHHAVNEISREEAHSYCNVDYADAFALVASVGEGDQETIIGVGRYYRTPSTDRAEAAWAVEDTEQARGIGTQLVEQIAFIAHERGIRVLEANVLSENTEMLRILRESGFPQKQTMQDGVYQVLLNVGPTMEAEERSVAREKSSTIMSFKSIMEPKSIAVVGASRRPGSIGQQVLQNILTQGYTGVAYPVNPTAPSICGVRSYASIDEIPGPVDMAEIMVAAGQVNDVLEQCARKGIKGAVIISAGFGEAGTEGVALQKKILATARSHGIRLLGPNCMGVINTDLKVSLNCTFASTVPPTGHVAFGSQSGALGLAILEYARGLNLGLSSFVSLGNRADISSNDLLEYWAADPNTDVILLYMESFGNPKRFARIARRVAEIKPIVAVKSGRTPAGTRAAASHTGALAAGTAGSDALFKQAGIIRVDTLEDLFNVANILAHQPLPKGRRVAIITNGGGPGIMTADALYTRGIELANLPENVVAQIKKIVPARASLGNPLDLTAEAKPDVYRQILEILSKEESVDIVIVLFVQTMNTLPGHIAAAIREAAPVVKAAGKTLVTSFMSAHGTPVELTSEKGVVPSFNFPETTATALGYVCEYADWLHRKHGVVPDLPGIDRPRVAKLIQKAQKGKRDRKWLDTTTVFDLLDAYGIKTIQSRNATSPEAAEAAARELGCPVAVKLLSDTISHKTEVGGVILNVETPAAVAKAYRDIQDRLKELGREKEMQGVTLQQMLNEGTEVIVGMAQDPTFGPLMMFGLGGIYAELFKDVTFRVHPLSDQGAHNMVREVKAFKLLQGWRGAKPGDIAAVEDLLLRVSAMVEDLPQLQEIDFNPVKVLEEGRGYAVVDARILVD
jgi:acetyltransferase